MTRVDLLRAFPTLVGRFAIPDHGPTTSALLDAVMSRATTLPSWDRANAGGWHSAPDLLTWPEPCVGRLTEWLMGATEHMIRATSDGGSFDGRLSIHAWANILWAGDHHTIHTHPMCCWSGALFLTSGGAPPPDRPWSGQLELLDPRPGCEMVFTPGHPYGHRLRFPPEPGTIVLFPSFLSHFVQPHAGPEPRVSIAFNVRAEPT